MRKMPKMIEEHHAKMRALRKAAREKKVPSEEKRYLQATGKTKSGPTWEVFRDERLKNEKRTK